MPLMLFARCYGSCLLITRYCHYFADIDVGATPYVLLRLRYAMLYADAISLLSCCRRCCYCYAMLMLMPDAALML